MASPQVKKYNLFRLIGEIFDEQKAHQWAFDRGLVHKEAWCPTHEKVISISPGPHFGIFRCRGKFKGRPYDHQKAVATNTWFERLHTDVRQRLLLTYCFSAEFNFKQAVNEASIKDSVVSTETVSGVYTFFREVCLISLDSIYVAEGKIGGPGVLVEIDECKIGKRK